MRFSRREFLTKGLGSFVITSFSVAKARGISLHCTPSPKFPVPLTAGVWRSAPFPIGKHDYHIWLEVDRRVPVEQLDCELGPPKSNERCDAPPLLDVEWKVWDGDILVKNWPAKPIRAAAWAETETSCFLGNFEGKQNGMFTLEWNVKRDAGRLKELHPRVQIVKNPGYWCWL